MTRREVGREKTGQSGGASRRDRALALFREAERDYLCPVCQENLLLSREGTFRCKKGHSFDLSARGTVNFIPNQKPVNYSRELFENRNLVFADGFYEDVAREIRDLTAAFVGSGRGGRAVNVLDVGCGEGYYSVRLSEDAALSGRCRFYAMDISKDAIQLASKNSASVGWMVADLARLPWKRRRIGVLLDVLTPANYGEFFRVLEDDGLLLKVIPGERYLREVRQAASSQLLNQDYDNGDVLSYFQEHARLLERRSVLREFPVNRRQAEAFLRMTPMTYHVDLSRVDAAQIHTITIHLEILVGRKRDAE